MIWLGKAVLLLFLTSTPVLSGNPFAECDAEFAAEPQTKRSSQCFYAVAKHQKNWAECSRRLEALWKLHPESNWLPFYLGETNYWRDLDRAIESFRAAARGFASNAEIPNEVLARNKLRHLLFRRGDAEAAGLEVQKVVRAAERSGDSSVIGRAQVLEGQHLTESGVDLGRARHLLRKALATLGPAGPAMLQGICLSNLGEVSSRLGRYQGIPPVLSAITDPVKEA